MNLDAAYTRCEEITRNEAKNFSYGIRLLPADALEWELLDLDLEKAVRDGVGSSS